MKAEKLAAILTKRYTGRDVLIYDTDTEEFIDLEPEDITPGFTDGPDSAGVHDVVLFDTDDEDTEGLSKAVILWKS
jgi:hypothetical protein